MTNRWILAGLLVAGLLLCPVVSWAAQSPWETIEWGKMTLPQKFKWSLDLYRMGRAEDSAEILKRVMAENPKPAAVMQMADLMSIDQRARMLADQRTSEATQQWARLVDKSLFALRTDEAYIASQVEKLTGDIPDQKLAMLRLKQLGEFAVPPVIKLMTQTPDTQVRARCYLLLLGMGRAAVVPAVACLKTPDAGTRAMILKLLGDLQDARAIAPISAIVAAEKSRSEGQPTETARAAAAALEHIRLNPNLALPIDGSPVVNYRNLADGYLHEKECCLPAVSGDQLPVWSWPEGGSWVVYTLVPAKLYNEKMCEAACYDALAIAPGEVDSRALLDSGYLAEKYERMGMGEKDDEVMHALDVVVLVGGREPLLASLAKSLADGDKPLAVQAAQALRGIAAGRGLTAEQSGENNPLLAALADDSLAVRFAAARAVVAMQPAAARGKQASFRNMDRVLPALAWGLMAAKAPDAAGPSEGAAAGEAKPAAGAAMEPSDAGLVAKLIGDIETRAAESLASIDAVCSPLPMPQVVPALRSALQSTNDAVRVPVLIALGNIAADEATLDVLNVAAEKKNEKIVRLTALRALAKIMEQQAQVPPDVFDKLVPITAEDDVDVSLAASRAISVAKFAPKQFTDLETLKRVAPGAAK